MPQPLRYHPALVALHWLLALLIIAMLLQGIAVLDQAPNSDPGKIVFLRAHVIGGVAVLLLMVIRLGVRWRTTAPAPATTGNRFLNGLSRTVHVLFYIVVLAMAGSGIALARQANLPDIIFRGHSALPPDFWVFTPRLIHYLISRLLILLLALHLAGALYHTFVLRDGLLARMRLRQRKPATNP